jgi:hypothetical protein
VCEAAGATVVTNCGGRRRGPRLYIPEKCRSRGVSQLLCADRWERPAGDGGDVARCVRGHQ